MAYSLSRYEQETIIRFDEEGPEAKLYTASPVWMRKMDKLTAENPADFREIRAEKCQGEICAKTYTFPKSLITIRTKARASSMTEEQKAAAAERIRAINAAKNQI